MHSNTISFEDAVEILAPAIGMHRSDTEALVVAAIQSGGEMISDAHGNKFSFSCAPKCKGFGGFGNLVANSDFDVFKVGNGWGDLDGGRKHDAPAREADDVSNKSAAKSWGLEDDWRYDRAQLIEALWRFGQPYNLRYEALESLRQKKDSKGVAGRKPNIFRDVCIEYLTGYYRGCSIPSRTEDMHDEIIDFMKSKGVSEDDEHFPESSTRKNWIAKIKEQVAAHK